MHTPSPAQAAYFRWIDEDQGSVIVEAVAGAGKTTTIVRGLERMRGYVALMAYNSKMAEELKERTAGMSRVYAQTFHGAGFKQLRYSFKDAKLVLDGKKVQKIADALVAEKQRPELADLCPTVCSVVSMAKQRGIGALSPIGDDAAWAEMIERFDLDGALPHDREGMLPQVIKMSQICLKRSCADLDTIDFDDMVYLPLQRNLRMLQNDWVIVDEAQDTNPTRRALARRMLKPSGRLVAVGDPHQAIYGFTGTDNDSLQQIERDFQCQRLPLTVTYRCPKSVVRVAREWVSHIEAHDSAPEGEVREYDYSRILDMVQVGDAVLCRFNKHLVSLVFRLIRAGVPAKIEGRAIGVGLVQLATRWRVRSLDALTGKLDTYLSRETERALAKGDETKAADVRDRVETMNVLIERARELRMSTVEELAAMIMTLFDDKVADSRSMVVLCSGHRSKGLEWDRVHILGLRELMPRTRHQWQMDQEINLLYVMATRAKSTLHIVSGLGG